MLVLTWNILAQFLIDKKDYPDISDADLDFNNRINKICNLLTNLNFDIAFLQEVTPTAVNIIEQKLPQNYRILPLTLHDQTNWTDDYKTETYGNLTIYNVDTISLVKHEKNHFNASGTAYDTTIFDIQNAQTLCINVHLDSESSTLRQSENDSIHKFLLDSKHTAIVIAGDFNTSTLDIHNTYNSFVPSVQNGITSILDLNPKKPIDYIYTKGLKATNRYIHPAQSLKHENDLPSAGPPDNSAQTLIYGSDHFPVIVEFNC